MAIDLVRYILQFCVILIDMYIYVIIAAVILSWLINFGIVNLQHPVARTFYQALLAVTEPVLQPIRRAMPDLGGIDISPIIVVIAAQFLQGLITAVLVPNLGKMIG